MCASRSAVPIEDELGKLRPRRTPLHAWLCGVYAQSHALVNLELLYLSFRRKALLVWFGLRQTLPWVFELKKHLGAEQMGAAVSSVSSVRHVSGRIKEKMDKH